MDHDAVNICIVATASIIVAYRTNEKYQLCKCHYYYYQKIYTPAILCSLVINQMTSDYKYTVICGCVLVGFILVFYKTM